MKPFLHVLDPQQLKYSGCRSELLQFCNLYPTQRQLVEDRSRHLDGFSPPIHFRSISTEWGTGIVEQLNFWTPLT
jgi:hypothetical protein